MPLTSSAQTFAVGGSIISVDPGGPSFLFKEQSGDTFEAIVGRDTNYRVLSNLGGALRVGTLSRLTPSAGDDDTVYKLRKYAVPGRHVFVRGVYQDNGGAGRYEARDVYLLHSEPQRY